jgi:hypothetical protein
MINLIHIFSIAKTEFKLGLRRGWTIVATAVPWIVFILSSLWLTWINPRLDTPIFDPAYPASGIEMSWASFFLLTIVLLVSTSSTFIPYDHQINIQGLIDSLPLTKATVIIGKTVGIWLLGLVTSVLCLSVDILLMLFINQCGFIPLLFSLFFVAVLPLVMWSIYFGVLIGSFFSTRKIAMIIGLFTGAFVSIFWSLPFRETNVSWMGITLGPSDFLTRQISADFIFNQFHLLPIYYPPITLSQVFLNFTLLLALLFLLQFGVNKIRDMENIK